MKRSPMPPRKAYMTRSGITRTDNRQCSKSEGPRVVKPGKRLRRKSKTNSNRHVDLKFRREYMDSVTFCEMMELFPRRSYCSVSVPGVKEASGRWMPATDPHHILWGQARRHDIRANLLAIFREAHDFCHKFKVDGMVLALTAKRLKGELEWSELDRISGKNIRGWLSCKPPVFDWVKPYWTALIGECE